MNIEDAKQLAKQGDREGAIALLRQMSCWIRMKASGNLCCWNWEWCIMPWERQRKR